MPTKSAAKLRLEALLTRIQELLTNPLLTPEQLQALSAEARQVEKQLARAGRKEPSKPRDGAPKPVPADIGLPPGEAPPPPPAPPARFAERDAVLAELVTEIGDDPEHVGLARFLEKTDVDSEVAGKVYRLFQTLTYDPDSQPRDFKILLGREPSWEEVAELRAKYDRDKFSELTRQFRDGTTYIRGLAVEALKKLAGCESALPESRDRAVKFLSRVS